MMPAFVGHFGRHSEKNMPTRSSQKMRISSDVLPGQLNDYVGIVK